MFECHRQDVRLISLVRCFQNYTIMRVFLGVWWPAGDDSLFGYIPFVIPGVLASAEKTLVSLTIWLMLSTVALIRSCVFVVIVSPAGYWRSCSCLCFHSVAIRKRRIFSDGFVYGCLVRWQFFPPMFYNVIQLAYFQISVAIGRFTPKTRTVA